MSSKLATIDAKFVEVPKDISWLSSELSQLKSGWDTQSQYKQKNGWGKTNQGYNSRYNNQNSGQGYNSRNQNQGYNNSRNTQGFNNGRQGYPSNKGHYNSNTGYSQNQQGYPRHSGPQHQQSLN